jgi:hypothetical protein
MRAAGLAGAPSVAPDLAFRVEGVDVLPFAAAPTLRFALRIECTSGEPVRSIALTTQIRIDAVRRRYDDRAQERLLELFGEPARWDETLRSLLWTQTTLVVPPFEGETLVDLPIASTYDFEVASAKYFAGLVDGAVPLELLFSGTLFYPGPAGLQAAQLPWDREARFRLPVATWRAAVDGHFPNSARLRLPRDAFDRLDGFRVRRGLPTWEAALDALLSAAEQEVGR